MSTTLDHVIGVMRERLDQLLVATGRVASRARARDLVVRGLVSIDGVVARRPAQPTDRTAVIAIVETANRYVSRGAEKLVAALDAFALDPAGRICLDVGASTGGFTEVLLSRGAAHVFAVDVGRDQLHPALRQDPRVTSCESTDVRTLDRARLPEPVAAITVDLSFISLAKALPAALACAAPGAWLAALVKPQFEVGPNAVGKGGIVRDEAAARASVCRVADWLADEAGWQVIGDIPSPILGGSGNREYLLGAHL